MREKMTEKECLEMGGHCYEMLDILLMSNPPQSVRKCKHCGKTQHGVPQESMRWD